MKKIQKSGITIVTLVITIIILVLLTGAVMLTMNSTDIFGNTQNTVDEHNKQAMLEQIGLKIETARLTKINNGETGFTIKEDIIPVVKNFGTYEEDTLKLTTRENNIEIYLYEILDIRVEEYVTATYRDKILTITEKEESLSSNGYKYEYTYDNGIVWQTYTTPVTIQEQSGIKIRLVNSEGQVISNEYVVTKGAGEETVNKIKAIAVTKAPTTTTYKQGQTFNPSGMEITVTYEDNTTKVVTNYNYTPTRALTVSDRYITISYTENGVTKQATQNITVTNKLTAIGITELKKTNYKQGETINKSDIVVKATYEDNTNKQVTNFTYEPTGALQATNTKVTVTYTEGTETKQASAEIQVAYLETIEITKAPTKTTYAIGENFDKAGMIVTAIYKYNNGTTYGLPVTNYTVIGGNSLQLGTTNVTISYTEGGITKDTSQQITVKEIIPPTIALTTNSNTTPAKVQSTTIQITEEYDVTYNYGWSESKNIAPTQWTSSTNKSQEVTIDSKDGNYYLWVKDLKDSYENKATTQTVAGIEVNLISEAFTLDNTKPSIGVIIAEKNGIQIMNIDIIEANIDLSNSGYVLSQSAENKGINISNYTDGKLTSNAEELKVGICGNYYLHVLATDIAGNTNTYVSGIISSSNTEYAKSEEETTYSYMNSPQEVQLQAGVYKLEVWGAAGGTYGGQGGYSVGTMLLQNSSNIFVVTGGMGGTYSGTTGGTGGYNGGGNGGNGKNGSSPSQALYQGEGGGGGGGATHIAFDDGELYELENNKESILIVAGGGGGGLYDKWDGWTRKGGDGGGETGADVLVIDNKTLILGGTQESGYSFGKGENGRSATAFDSYGAEGAGGGGGGLYGGCAQTVVGANSDSAGAGGAGYVSSVLTNATTTVGAGSSGEGYAKITQYIPGYQYIE